MSALGVTPIVTNGTASPAPPTPPAPQQPAASAPWLREDLIHLDPLLDCLVEVCRLNGCAASRASLSAGLPLSAEAGGGMTRELVERAAERAGMWAKLLRLPLACIDPATLPAILVLKDKQACVLLG